MSGRLIRSARIRRICNAGGGDGKLKGTVWWTFQPPKSGHLKVLSGFSFAGAGLGYKIADRWQCRSSVFIFVFAITGGAFAGIKTFFETTVWLDPKLWLLGIAMGLLFDLAIYFIMQANRLGPASASWTVLNLGLLVPIFVSPFIIDEAAL
jgi:hypothetical protein